MLDILHSGELYFPLAGEITELQTKCLEKLYDYNQTRPSEGEKREAMLRDMFAELGEGCYIEPPLHANWGGRFVRLGKNVYANFGLTLVDDTHIYVGDFCMFGPHVTVATAGHPILPPLREQGLPTATTPEGRSLVTTLPAPTTVLSPMVTPGMISAPAPIQQLRPMRTGALYCRPRSRSSGRMGWPAVAMTTLGPNMQQSPI